LVLYKYLRLFILRSFTLGVKELEKFNISWCLRSNISESAIKRYCHNCGKVTLFRDSMERRHNANGKKIYQYAIYKCEKDHTWNLKLSIYKAYTKNIDKKEEMSVHAPPEAISLPELRERDIAEIEIYIIGVEGKWRLDNLLSQKLIGITRSEIVKWMKQGHILVDGVKVKPGVSIHEDQRIWIDLDQ
jgi:hypothetical protein